MSFKTFLQILVICLIFAIIGTVYLLYFKENKDLIQKQSENLLEKQSDDLVEKQSDDLVEKQSENLLEKQSENLVEKQSDDTELEKLSTKNNENNFKEKKENKKTKKIKEQDSENLLNEIEYVGTDKKGNKYKIFAKSGKTNKEDRSLLDLTDVRGIVSSANRPNIYIVSDFAIYNSSNLNSNFYKNVIINYEEKQIDCDFFDLNMKTNFATAYGNVIVTDPTSIMRAGKINLNIKTKDIEITPEKKSKVQVLTN